MRNNIQILEIIFNNIEYGNYKQDLNLHYVGVTRAKKGCILLSSSKRTNYRNHIKNSKESEFLFLNGIENLRENWENVL